MSKLMGFLERASALANHMPRVVASSAVLVAFGSGCLAASASATTATFTPGGAGEFVVPPGVTQVEVAAIGGAGEAGGECLNDGYPAGGASGSGAKVTATLPVTGLNALYIHFGGGGAAGPSPGGCIPQGGAGGGATDVRTEEGSPASRVLVAGGGGGGGSGDAAFSAEFGLVGGAGGSAAGATGGNGGESGNNEFGFFFALASGGDGASTSAPGKGGAVNGSCAGGEGSGGEGGAGTSGSGCGGAGGAGGGYFGGGAGAGSNNGGGGGGAGSSYIAAGDSGEITSGAGEPQQVVVSYTVPSPPNVLIASPASGRSYVQGALVKTEFACSDGEGGPGIESCLDSNGGSGTSGELDTTSLGAHTYTVTTRSSDGLTGKASITYTVVAATPEAPHTSQAPQPPATSTPPSSIAPKACASRRTLVIHPALHLRLRRGTRIVSAEALLHGRPVAEANGPNPSLDVSFAGFAKGAYEVALVVRTSNAKTRTLFLLLHTCGTSAP
jgi:hypothetical protein